MLPNLVRGGVLSVRSLLRNHLPNLLLGEIHLRVDLIGMDQRLFYQLLVVVGYHAGTAFAMPLSHFILLPKGGSLGESPLRIVQRYHCSKHQLLGSSPI